MNHSDFRVRGKTFATLWPKEKRGVVLLTREQQHRVTAAESAVCEPVPGGWGLRGATSVHLELADAATVRSALVMAWRN